MKIWQMKLECVGGAYLEEKAAKICEIPTNYSLSKLCPFILESFDFENDHLHEFFISTGPFSGKRTVSDENITINDLFPMTPKHSLFMWFDFGDDWTFKIAKRAKKVEYNSNIEYPRVIEHIGNNPEQYPMCEMEEEEEYDD